VDPSNVKFNRWIVDILLGFKGFQKLLRIAQFKVGCLHKMVLELIGFYGWPWPSAEWFNIILIVAHIKPNLDHQILINTLYTTKSAPIQKSYLQDQKVLPLSQILQYFNKSLCPKLFDQFPD
jgi:hypothetical protein